MKKLNELYAALDEAKRAVMQAEAAVYESLIKAGHKSHAARRFWWSDEPELCNVSKQNRYVFDATPEALEIVKASGVEFLVGVPNHKSKPGREMIIFGII